MTEQTTTGTNGSANTRAIPFFMKSPAFFTKLSNFRVMRSKLDLAWAGGMVDGEGTITVVRQTYQPGKNGRRRNPTCRLKLVVVQNDWSTLDRLKKILGGVSYLNEVPLKPTHNSRIFQLQFDGAHALAAIEKLEPYLYRKKQHAHCAKSFWREGQMGTRPGRKGVAPAILAVREKWIARLRRLK